MFPSQLGNVDLRTFYRGINDVQPSMIRVEADEATYNLHVMLRIEIEIAVMEGNITVKDLPEAWNDKDESISRRGAVERCGRRAAGCTLVRAE